MVRRALLLASCFALAATARAQLVLEADFSGSARLGDALALEAGVLLASSGSPAVVRSFAWRPLGWSELAPIALAPPDPSADFGRALALAGGTALVGAPGVDGALPRAGAVFAYELAGSDWMPVELIAAPDPLHSRAFGSAIDTQGAFAAIGAPRDDERALGAGAVHVFERVAGAWTERAKLLDPTALADERLGSAVALRADRLAAGAPFGSPALGAGRALVFSGSGSSWQLEAALDPFDGELGDAFGAALALGADVLAVGAPHQRSSPTVHAGAVYVYERSGSSWSFRQKLSPVPPPDEGMRFGAALAFCGEWLVVGAPETGVVPGILEGRGAAFVYERAMDGSWQLVDSLAPLDVAPGDRFGAPIAGGAVQLAFAAPRAPALYAYRSEGAGVPLCFGDGTGSACPCQNEGPSGGGCANSTGVGAVLAAAGDLDLASDSLVLGAAHLPLQPVLLFAGANAVANGAGAPFGAGLRCAGGSVARLGVEFPGPDGQALWGPGLSARGGWSAGDQRIFQAWYRDPAFGGCGALFNLSNAVGASFGP